MIDNGTGKLHTKDEAAEILHVSPITIHRQIKAGKLGNYRFGAKVMISRQHVENYLALCERTPRIEPKAVA